MKDLGKAGRLFTAGQVHTENLRRPDTLRK